MPTQSALERAGYKLNEFVAWEEINDTTLALMHADYVRATIDRMDVTQTSFDFNLQRREIISEIHRMVDWLTKSHEF